MEESLIRRLWKVSFFVAIGCVVLISQNRNSSGVALSAEAEHTVHLPLLRMAESTAAGIYYLSPQGNDSNSGKTESQAWATFDRALNKWAPGNNKLGPGDTLILLDGVYYQSLHPDKVSGEPGRPITVRAQHDGRAIIDGQGVLNPIWLEEYRAAVYYVIEGIVARNGLEGVIRVSADHNVLRRVSAYNANPDGNTKVIGIGGEYNLLEDCVAAGSGRKMILVFKGEHNVIRRCFADWQQWDGRQWHDCWPWGDGIELYNASYNIIENSISYSRNPTWSISLLAQGGDTSSNNKILGTMAILSGMKEDVTPMVWGDTRPQPTTFTCMRNFEQWPGQRAGFNVYQGGSPIRNNLWQDVFSWGNAGLGLSWITGGTGNVSSNNHVNRATVINNGLSNPDRFGGIGTDAIDEGLARFDGVKNSNIGIISIGGSMSARTTMAGEGARLTHRYVDGVLMDGSNGQPAQLLWPWPMEDRIRAELGISVTEMMTEIISGTSH